MNSPCFLRTSAMFPSVPTYSVTPIAGSSFQNYPARTRTLSSPVFLHSLAESAFEPPPVPAPALQNLVVTPTPQTLEQRSSRLIQQPKPTYPTFPCLRPCPAITHDYPFSPRYQSASMLPSLPSAVRSTCLLTTQMHACCATPCGARHDTQTARIPTVTQDTFELALALALPINARSTFNTELLAAASAQSHA